ncbi:thiamine phosphate synthase [Geofilum rubicundum]|uniref:Thiamin-phosphate pyrophosphorylase n=1 Tax=Geofilum rubicundum JCM 15548 TaxID=1236989 RepID=A0A0E9M258_9BACT|nr:thiamine phosphate synthase [Geofilum rubicundum]GAO31456.1 thiamin-phosphate pyrophosphorylase [Geofilum rubicundum JCM 15548]
MLIAITQPSLLKQEALAIEALLKAGVDYVHVRKPGYVSEEVRALLNAVPEPGRPCLSVHYHHQAARRSGVGGLHRTKGFAVTDGKGCRVSASCHSLAEVKALTLADCQYVFLSPVFDSISKKGYASAFSKASLSEFLSHKETDMPAVVALGGITKDNVGAVRQMGFDGAALLGALWVVQKGVVDVPATVERFFEIQEQWKTVYQ